MSEVDREVLSEARQAARTQREQAQLVAALPAMEAQAAREDRRQRASEHYNAAWHLAREAVETGKPAAGEVRAGFVGDIASLWRRMQEAYEVNSRLRPALANLAGAASNRDAAYSYDPGTASEAVFAGHDLAVDQALAAVGAFSEDLALLPEGGNEFAREILAVCWRYMNGPGPVYNPRARATQFKRGGNPAM